MVIGNTAHPYGCDLRKVSVGPTVEYTHVIKYIQINTSVTIHYVSSSNVDVFAQEVGCGGSSRRDNLLFIAELLPTL